MRMYVILAVLGLLLLVTLICFASMTVRARSAARSERKREEVAARLAPVVAQAAQEYQTRTAAAQVSAELTAVLPAIRPDDGQQPRKGLAASGLDPGPRSSGVSQTTDIGGSTIEAEAGRPCHGIGTAWTLPRLPRPLPP